MVSSFFGLDVEVSKEVKGIIIIALTLIIGFSSGLLLCLFSLDTNRLNALIQNSNTKDARMSRRVMMLLHKPNWVLVTLVLLMDLAVEMIPLLFNMFLNPISSIFVSVGIILVFGEIIPQALFIRHALQVSAAMAYVVLFLMCLTSPITWPIGKLLDVLVGDKEVVFLRRREIRELIRLQEEIRNENRARRLVASNGDEVHDLSDPEQDISPVEAGIMLGVLGMSEHSIREIIKHEISLLYCLHRDTILSKELIEGIFSKGLEFIPVYDDVNDRSNITRLLETKALILLIHRRSDDPVRLADLPLHPLPRLPGTALCSESFELLQHMVCQVLAVADDDGEVIGVVTMKDIVEFIHQTSFQAEMDPGTEAPLQLMMQSWRALRELHNENHGVGHSHGDLLLSQGKVPRIPEVRDTRYSSAASSHSTSPLLRRSGSQPDLRH